MDVAERAGFELLITTDQSIRYQQNMAGRRLAVIVLLSQSWPYTQAKIEEIQTAIDEVTPGELKEVCISRRGES